MANEIIVMVTCGTPKEAKRIAHALVEKRLAACVNVATAPVESVYRWKEKVETAKEYLLIIKTTQRKFAPLQREIQRLHSYEVPEIIALPVRAGAPAYLRWLAESVR